VLVWTLGRAGWKAVIVAHRLTARVGGNMPAARRPAHFRHSRGPGEIEHCDGGPGGLGSGTLETRLCSWAKEGTGASAAVGGAWSLPSFSGREIGPTPWCRRRAAIIRVGCFDHHALSHFFVGFVEGGTYALPVA